MLEHNEGHGRRNPVQWTPSPFATRSPLHYIVSALDSIFWITKFPRKIPGLQIMGALYHLTYRSSSSCCSCIYARSSPPICSMCQFYPCCPTTTFIQAMTQSLMTMYVRYVLYNAWLSLYQYVSFLHLFGVPNPRARGAFSDIISRMPSACLGLGSFLPQKKRERRFLICTIWHNCNTATRGCERAPNRIPAGEVLF